MLILSRKEHEEIQIGEHILVTVLTISKRYVRLGITAPRSVTIHRTETLKPMEPENPALQPTVQAVVDVPIVEEATEPLMLPEEETAK